MFLSQYYASLRDLCLCKPRFCLDKQVKKIWKTEINESEPYIVQSSGIVSVFNPCDLEIQIGTISWRCDFKHWQDFLKDWVGMWVRRTGFKHDQKRETVLEREKIVWSQVVRRETRKRRLPRKTRDRIKKQLRKVGRPLTLWEREPFWLLIKGET